MKDPIQQFFLRVMKVLILIALSLSFLAELLHNVTQSELVVAGATISVTSYFVRKRRVGPTRRSNTASTGERTPIMPRTDS